MSETSLLYLCNVHSPFLSPSCPSFFVGTTGPPKAVMISHDNVTWTAKVCHAFFILSSPLSLISLSAPPHPFRYSLFPVEHRGPLLRPEPQGSYHLLPPHVPRCCTAVRHPRTHLPRYVQDIDISPSAGILIQSVLLFDSTILLSRLGCSVYFCQPDALKGSLTVTMREVRPTLFFSVPRVWEKIQEKMVQMGRQTTGIKKVKSMTDCSF